MDRTRSSGPADGGPFRTSANPGAEIAPGRNARHEGADAKGPACPRCHTPLDSAEGPPGCARCGGVFLDRGDLEKLAASTAEDPFLLHAPEARQHVATEPYISCPFCHALMDRRVFADHTGIAVDICAKHGTWFDGGELASAVERVPHASRIVEKSGETARHAATNAAVAPVAGPDAAARALIEVAVTNVSTTELFYDRREIRRNAWFAADFVSDLIKMIR